MKDNPVVQPQRSRQLPGPRWRLAVAGLAGLAALAVLFSYDPAASTLFPPCPFHALTGLYCPGCGTLRALHQLSHGNILAAMGMNPLTVLSLPFVGYGILSSAALMAAGRRLPGIFMPPVWIWMLLAVVITFWVLRNLPVFPFSWLAP